MPVEPSSSDFIPGDSQGRVLETGEADVAAAGGIVAMQHRDTGQLFHPGEIIPISPTTIPCPRVRFG
jgi:hypothetical protein